MTNPQDKFKELVEIVAQLRDPQTGCPWDLKQTHQSLIPYLLEESYEFIDAIQHEPHKKLDELGDVLLQVMLHSQIAKENGEFTIGEVVDNLCEKLIRRHPHVFGDKSAADSEAALENWEEVKRTENQTDKKGALSGVPRSMPGLMAASKLGYKAARVGFDWDQHSQVQEKVAEELAELQGALDCDSHDAAFEEIGDLLFTLAQLSRKLSIDPEQALQSANKKFINRFGKLEERIEADWSTVTPEQLDKLWNSIKAEEKAK